MQVCISLQTDNHASTPRQPRQHPTSQFFTGRMPFLPPNQQRQSRNNNDDFVTLFRNGNSTKDKGSLVMNEGSIRSAGFDSFPKSSFNIRELNIKPRKIQQIHIGQK